MVKVLFLMCWGGSDLNKGLQKVQGLLFWKTALTAKVAVCK